MPLFIENLREVCVRARARVLRAGAWAGVRGVMDGSNGSNGWE